MSADTDPVPYWITEAMIRRVVREEFANHLDQSKPEKLAYTVAEAAWATGYSEELIRGQIRHNYITAVFGSPGRQVILADELMRWLRSLPEDPRRAPGR